MGEWDVTTLPFRCGVWCGCGGWKLHSLVWGLARL